MQNTLNKIFTEHKAEDIIQIILSNPRKKSQPLKKINIRPISIDAKQMFQMESHYENKVLHYNFEFDEISSHIYENIKSNFKQINFFTKNNDIQILVNKVDNPKIKTLPPTKKLKENSYSHNRKKNYILSDGTPYNFLVHLGVMNKDGKVLKQYYSKFKQINRFLEIVSDCIPALTKDLNQPLKIIDFGCGKSYLTFALYHYLKNILNLDVDIIGLDLKENVIEKCNKIAKELGFNSLRFELGDIAEYQDTFCHMVVTLHACDTATDFALINAVNWNAKVILSVPCCQHELFKQIDNPIDNPMLKHGIIKDKFTELITDGLRGLKLESKGYNVSMIEFTSLEHTSKNIMIKAIKKEKFSEKQRLKVLSEYENLKTAYNVNPTIDLMK